jgi:outer membrane immunogenic protein
LVRRNLLGSTALTTSTTLIAGAAWAADMAVKAPPRPVVIPFSWNGCYAGLNAGGAWVDGREQVTVPGITVIDSSGTTGAFIGGGQIGCNWQYDPKWVVGLEGDLDYVSAKRTSNFAFTHHSEDVVGQQSLKLRWLSTVRARFGYAWERSLLYATGGLAIGEINPSVSATDTTRVNAVPVVVEQFAGSSSATRVGWTLGAGFEYAFTDKVSAKLEYLYFDLGHVNYGVNVTAGASALPPAWTASAGATGNIVRVGVNVKFN